MISWNREQKLVTDAAKLQECLDQLILRVEILLINSSADRKFGRLFDEIATVPAQHVRMFRDPFHVLLEQLSVMIAIANMDVIQRCQDDLGPAIRHGHDQLRKFRARPVDMDDRRLRMLFHSCEESAILSQLKVRERLPCGLHGFNSRFAYAWAVCARVATVAIDA